MSSPIPTYFRAPLAAALVSMLACSAIETTRANDALAAKLEPLVGKSIDVVFDRLGPPERRLEFGNEQVWHYYKSYGIRNASAGSELPGNLGSGRPQAAVLEPDPATGARSAHEAFDRYTIYFVDGVAVRWEGQAAR